MKKISVSILSVFLMLSMVFSSSVFAANDDTQTSAWDAFTGLFTKAATTDPTQVDGVTYQTHVQNYGWAQGWVSDGKTSGTVGESLRLEGIEVKIDHTKLPVDLGITYQTQIENDGWAQGWISNGELSGSQGRGLRLEGIQIKLTGAEAVNYSVRYKTQIQNVGWENAWSYDGATSGTVGLGLRLEAIQIEIVQKTADLTAYNAAIAAVKQADYTTASWTAYQAVVTAHPAVTTDLQTTVDAATAAITAAQANLAKVVKVESVSAINSTQATVTFSGAVKAVVPANFTVTDANGNQAFVSNAVLNAAKDTATLTFFNAFANNGVYSVVTTAVVDANSNVVPTSTNAFTYVTAPVASVQFIGTTILPSSNAKTLVKVTDTLGRDVTAETNVTFESSNLGVVNASGLTANPSTPTADSAIVVAKVAVGTTFVRSANTIISVSSSTAAYYTGSYVYSGTPAPSTADFAKLTAEQKVDFVNIGDSTKKLAAYYTDQFGKDGLSAVVAFNGGAATLTNLNPNVVIVENDGTIKPISVGSGYVKIVNGTVTTTVKITVKAAPVIASLTADKTTVSIGTAAPLNTQTVNVTYKDQFGTSIDPVVVDPATLKATPADTTIATAAVATSSKSLVITGLKEGTTTVALSYKVDANTTLTQNIAVTVTKAGTLAGYTVENAAATLDLNTANLADPKTPNTSIVKVFSVDANGNKIAELTTAQFSLSTVDATGTPATDIVTAATNTVTAKAVGTGYVQVKVNTLLINTLTYNIINTAAVPTTATFNSLAIVLGESPSLPILINDELAKIVAVQDQTGTAIIIDPDDLVFEYTITNISGLTFSGSANAESLATITAQSGLADIVVTKVTLTPGTTNLLATPVVVRLSATDTTKPVVTGVTEGQVGNVTAGITPAFTVGTGTLSKDGGTATAYTSATKVSAVGAYVLTVTDLAGNATTVNFSIVTDANLAKANITAATIAPITVAFSTDKATTVTAVQAAVKTALEAKITNATVTVVWSDAPATITGPIVAANYNFAVTITGTDTSTGTITAQVVNVTIS